MEGCDIKSPRIYCDSGKFQFKSFKEDLSLNGKIIVYFKVRKIIEKYSKDISNYPDSYIDLLMFIYGYETSSYNGVKFYYKGYLKNFLRTIQTFRLFMSKQVFPVSEKTIIRKLGISKSELDFLIFFIDVEVQKTEEGVFYQTHIKDLFNNCLKIYRVLHEASHPMHLLEIKDKIIKKEIMLVV